LALQHGLRQTHALPFLFELRFLTCQQSTKLEVACLAVEKRGQRLALKPSRFTARVLN
jgi:hypothetical protein